MTNATDLSLACRAAEQAAYAAGTHLLTSRTRLAEAIVTQRTAEAIVAEIDLEAEALIREVVQRHFPDYAFLGKQSRRFRDDGRPLWVVDALDGRANYLRGHRQYAVSIALVIEGEPHIGVVYDPCSNEFFGAIRGQGAVLNGEPIQCASPNSPRDMLAATVFPDTGSARRVGHMAEMGRVLSVFGGVRRSSCMSLEMAHLAAGRIDAFWEHDMTTWNAAAGVALLRESGALVESRDGEPVLLSRSLVAFTPAVRDGFLDVLAPA